jgi:hypothetical protein
MNKHPPSLCACVQKHAWLPSPAPTSAKAPGSIHDQGLLLELMDVHSGWVEGV